MAVPTSKILPCYKMCNIWYKNRRNINNIIQQSGQTTKLNTSFHDILHDREMAGSAIANSYLNVGKIFFYTHAQVEICCEKYFGDYNIGWSFLNL